jgi:demethylmenaquinone methyltransferase / 2-methoxy-6-polyprenyl-1,4-benzoquinol methylase
LTGVREAYKYLPDTTENFVTAEDMAARMTKAGFKNVKFQRLMFGTIAIHWGEK